MGSKELGDVTYATIGSIINIAYKFKEMGVTKIIIDELIDIQETNQDS